MGVPPHFRRAKRRPVAIYVRYRRDVDGAAFEQIGSTTDLGLGGAFIETARPPPVGSKVLVILNSPTAWDPLELHAEVRWVHEADTDEPTGFGIRFGELSGYQATALYELVQASAYVESETEIDE